MGKNVFRVIDQFCGFSESSGELHVTILGSISGSLQNSESSDLGSGMGLGTSRLVAGVDISRSVSCGSTEEAEDIFEAQI